MNKKLRAQFRDFLYANGALLAWHENVKTLRTVSINDVYKSEKQTPQQVIMGSFIWIETSEGGEYWSDLNIKWHKELGT